MSITPYIISYIDNLKKEPLFRNFFTTLERYGDIIIVGGALRDVASNRIPRDLDIILKENKEFEWRCLDSLNYKMNRFGGAKLKIKNLEIDFWLMKDNWANKNNFIKNEVEELTKGTFFNVDSLVFDYSKKVIYEDYYNQCLNTRILDIVLKENRKYIYDNPTPEINIVRAFHNKKKYDLEFSETVIKYIYNWALNVSAPEKRLKEFERKHYRNLEIFNECEYSFFLDEIKKESNKFKTTTLV